MVMKLNCRGGYSLSFDKTVVMGVLNVTPDSFSDGGLFVDVETAVSRAKQMVSEGAGIIDVGGESTKPGSEPVSADAELARVAPVIKRLVAELEVPISIDTMKPLVARECLELGVHLVNDVTGLRDAKMAEVAASFNSPVVIMHMQGEPKTMQQNPSYTDVVSDVLGFFRERIKKAEDAGVKDIVIDPGIGFGKTTSHNLQLLKRLSEFKELGKPILVGPSRKSFIGNISGLPVNERLVGTLAAVSIAVLNGANLVRVHDVLQCKRASEIAEAIRDA